MKISYRSLLVCQVGKPVLTLECQLLSFRMLESIVAYDMALKEDLHEAQNEDKNEIVIITRLLVPNNLVGCLLGRKGDVIQKLQSEIGASIHVQSAEHLPVCVMTTDELVQLLLLGEYDNAEEKGEEYH
ncbi:hypothetical protein A4A49_52628 [Nicotiana attenuata]|uniref:K Homology domain-containing protein n=1 Tax=Nicotiana attenuata TaxID=49451 RepID=A0A314KKS4_NICAT|nr:hypothetical protein A4A49_52628 [Nicotiana attenuata]